MQERTATLEEEITQHRETTKRLRISESYINDILRSMPLMLAGLDKDCNIVQWNSRAEEISGTKAEDAIGNNLWEVYPTITVQPQQVEQAREQNRTITVKHCQRGQYHFDITIYPLGEQSETGIVVLIDDVTQQILAENMLIQRDKMSSMGELAASMAYDINTPLRAILDDVDQVLAKIEQTSAEAPEVELLRDATVRGQQVAAVVSNLLAFANSRGGEKKLCDITNIIDYSIELAQDILSEASGLRFRDIEIKRRYADNLPEIPCYAAELQQVFLSLFRHSCHALGSVERDNFTPTISIEVQEAYSTLWVRVQHNGRGISIQEQQFIFEPFFNNQTGEESDATSRLSFSHFIITEQHRGEMAITSDVNVGSTFHIQLQLD